MQEEFNRIYNETYNTILKYVISKTDNISNVKDIMQNVYVNFYRSLKKRGINYFENINSYLIKLCKSELFKYYSLKNIFKYVFSSEEDEQLFIEAISANENFCNKK